MNLNFFLVPVIFVSYRPTILNVPTYPPGYLFHPQQVQYIGIRKTINPDTRRVRLSGHRKSRKQKKTAPDRRSRMTENVRAGGAVVRRRWQKMPATEMPDICPATHAQFCRQLPWCFTSF